MAKKKRTERFLWPKAGVCSKDIRRSSIVQVDWNDAASIGKWEPNEREPGLAKCTTVGFLLRRAPKHITLVGSFSNDNHHGEAISIPRAWINRIQVIRRAP